MSNLLIEFSLNVGSGEPMLFCKSSVFKFGMIRYGPHDPTLEVISKMQCTALALRQFGKKQTIKDLMNFNLSKVLI